MEELKNEIAELKQMIHELRQKPVFTSMDDYYRYEAMTIQHNITQKVNPENMKKSADVIVSLNLLCSNAEKDENYQFKPTELESPFIECLPSPIENIEKHQIEEGKMENKKKEEKALLVLERMNAINWNKFVRKQQQLNKKHNQKIRENNLVEPLLPEGDELECLFREVPELN